jgi:AbrB family looped-hinge helix DNA binding protein
LITEVVKVDAKGRITIPAYIRLLLNIDDNGKILLKVDEDRGVITLRVFQENWIKCHGKLNKQELAKILNEVKVIALKCLSSENKFNEYRCDLVIDGKSSSEELLGNLNCFGD